MGGPGGRIEPTVSVGFVQRMTAESPSVLWIFHRGP